MTKNIGRELGKRSSSPKITSAANLYEITGISIIFRWCSGLRTLFLINIIDITNKTRFYGEVT